MNAQTPGPLIEQGNRLMTPTNPSVAAIPARLNDSDEWEHHTPQNAANAALLAASYTAFDKAGRELGIDAAELARAVDLAALIRCANALRLDPKADPFARACAQTLWDKLPH